MSVAVRRPHIEDYGIYADHDQACAVCRDRHAVLRLDGWVFEPCWQCQAKGWRIDQRRPLWKRLTGALR